MKPLVAKAAETVTPKNALGRGIELITLLTSGFGGVLFEIAPPEETDVSFTVGIASFAALIIYIIVLVMARGRLKAKHKRVWFAAAIAFFGCFLFYAFKYNSDRDHLTFLWPPNEANQELRVAGDSLTPAAAKAKQDDPSLTNAQLVSEFGGFEFRTRVWLEQSILQAGTTLKVDYVMLFLSVATAVFCATEGILLRNPKTKTKV